LLACRVPPISTLECSFMITRNGVRVDTQQLRDIQDLISKLADVNKQLAQPIHAVPLTHIVEAPVVETPVFEAPVFEAPVREAQTADAASA
jgi:hypothetical protein